MSKSNLPWGWQGQMIFGALYLAPPFVFLALGPVAAYQGDWIVVTLWAITCALENVSVSIDRWVEKIGPGDGKAK